MPWQAQSRRGIELRDKQEHIRSILATFRTEVPCPPGNLTPVVRAILSFIHEHLFHPDLNVSAVRRSCNLRDNNISSRFRCAVGMDLREYIELGRLEAAKRLLRCPQFEIYLIAMSVGYEHQETFGRAFQRHCGCNPSEWRMRLYGKAGEPKELETANRSLCAPGGFA